MSGGSTCHRALKNFTGNLKGLHASDWRWRIFCRHVLYMSKNTVYIFLLGRLMIFILRVFFGISSNSKQLRKNYTVWIIINGTVLLKNEMHLKLFSTKLQNSRTTMNFNIRQDKTRKETVNRDYIVSFHFWPAYILSFSFLV